MKRTIAFIAFIALCQVLAFGQKKYEMVIEKTDGSEIAVNVEDIVRTYFRERTDGTLTLSAYSVELKVDETKFVEILSGSGWYNTNTSNPNIVTVASNGSVISLTGKGAGTAEVTVSDAQYQVTQKISVTVTASEQPVDPPLSCPDANHPHWIDLGIGTQWRCCNAGANAPEDYGDYYTFNEAQAYNPPSLDQIEALINNCTYTWTSQNGVNGGKFTGPNGCTIFLPAGGIIVTDGDLLSVSIAGNYWSSTPSNEKYACYYCFDFVFAEWFYNLRRCGLSVRPVRK